MAKRVTIKDRGWNKIFRQINAEARKGASIADVGWTDPDQAAKATYLEFGTSRMRARPFIRPTVDANRARYLRALDAAAHAVLDGESSEGALRDVAEAFKSDLEDACPVDTGALRDAITIAEGGD